MNLLDKYWRWRTHRQIDFMIPMTVYEYVTYLENTKYIYVDFRAGGKIYIWNRFGYNSIAVEAYLTIDKINDVNTLIEGVIQATNNSRIGWKMFIYLSLIGIVFASLFDLTVLLFPIVMFLISLVGIPYYASHQSDYLLSVITNGHDISATPTDC